MAPAGGRGRGPGRRIGYALVPPWRRPVDDRQPSVAKAVAQFALTGISAVAVLLVVFAMVLQGLGTDQAIRTARVTTQLVARDIVEPQLQDGVVRGDPAAVAALDRVVREHVLTGTMVRVKIWSPDGRIVYSDEPRLIGRSYPLEEDDREVLRTGRTEAEVSDLSEPENEYERHEGKLLEVYLPIRTPDGQQLIFESYQRFSAVAARGERVFRDLAPAFLGGLLLAGLVQLPLGWSMARRLAQGREDRERLLVVRSRLAAIVESSGDAIIGTDLEGRITSWNPAAERIYGYTAAEVLGRPVVVLEAPGGDSNLHEVTRRAAAGATVHEPPALAVRKDGRQIRVAVTSSPVQDETGRTVGTAMVARDVTAEWQAGQDRDRLLAQRTRVAHTLQASLRPPELMAPPGMSLGARFCPAGDGAEIGGDFYDVYPTVADGWAITLGDVSGKGAEAAALTALARYTLRSVAMFEAGPRRILQRLNEAVIRQCAEDEYCTVAYASVHGTPAGARLVLSLGGHPPPLVLRRDGRVETVGEPGTVIGLLPDPDLHEVPVELAAGESICFYTDGVSEARVDGVQFGDEGIRAVLAGCRGLPADSIARRVEQAVRTFQGRDLTDDLAVLVLQPLG